MTPGLMMAQPLLISNLLQHAERHHADTEIVSRSVEGPLHRYTWRQAGVRARQLAQALARLGIGEGSMVGTLAWNGYRHLETYYAVSGMGAICHTTNPRLFPEQIRYIVNHAEDQVLLFDLSFLPLVEQLAPSLPGVLHYILLTDEAHMPANSSLPGLLCYETLLAAENGHYSWPQLDEQAASSLCYTSGTTGNPKGVLYSHRSTVLHALVSGLPDQLDLSATRCVMPVVPMFHVNGWGLPYSTALNGCKLVLPGAQLDGASLQQLIVDEDVDMAAGVPTIWLMLVQHCQKHGATLGRMNRVICGGSAPPQALIEQLEALGCELRQLWGMTELSPVGTTSCAKYTHRDADLATRRRLQTQQGRPTFGVDFRVVNDAGAVLPHDGQTSGRLQVRGPWVLSQYFRQESGDSHSADGWFDTGDVVSIDSHHYMKITDRSKDVIKSGGEWISSIELENILVAHPAVAEAAAIGVPHPKWDERPLLLVVLKPGMAADSAELLRFFNGKVPRWWLPDAVRIVDSLPHTATGKLLKVALRQQYADFAWPEI